MTFVITQPCIDVRDQSCVEVCPVDCIHYEDGADRMLFIDPTVCIDCGACEPACPVDAIYAEADVPPEQAQFTPLNALWYEDAPAARAQVADIPADAAAVASSGGGAAAAPAGETTPDEAPAAPAAAAAAPAPAAAPTPEPAAEHEHEPIGAYKIGESGIEGKCALCGTYVIKGGTRFRHKSVICQDCAERVARVGNPYRRVAGRS